MNKIQHIVWGFLCIAMHVCLFSQSSVSPCVLFVVTTFPAQSGTAVLNQITGLIDRNFDVEIYAKKQGDILDAHPDVYTYGLLDKLYVKTFPDDLMHYDIIYCQFGYRGLDVLVELKKNQGKARPKFISCFRGADASRHVQKNPTKYRQLFNESDYIFPVCAYFGEKLIHLGCDRKKIRVHHSAIDCKKFSYKERKIQKGKKINIVSVARFIEKKGFEYSIRAVVEVAKKIDIEYTLVGFGVLEQEFRDLIHSLGAESIVKIYGKASQDEIVSILNKAHIFVLTSLTAEDGDQEGIPNSVKEAMASGVPVVSTNHSGIPELIQDRVSGLLVPERDIVAIQEAIALLIDDKKLYKSIQKNARKKVENEFEKERVNDVLAEFFRNIIAA